MFRRYENKNKKEKALEFFGGYGMSPKDCRFYYWKLV